MACPGPIAKRVPSPYAVSRSMPALSLKNSIAWGSHCARGQADVDEHASGAVAHQMNDRGASRRIVVVQSAAHEHLLAVERPAFRKHTVAVNLANEIRVLIRDRKLQEVSWDAFVRQHR